MSKGRYLILPTSLSHDCETVNSCFFPTFRVRLIDSYDCSSNWTNNMAGKVTLKIGIIDVFEIIPIWWEKIFFTEIATLDDRGIGN